MFNQDIQKDAQVSDTSYGVDQSNSATGAKLSFTENQKKFLPILERLKEEIYAPMFCMWAYLIQQYSDPIIVNSLSSDTAEITPELLQFDREKVIDTDVEVLISSGGFMETQTQQLMLMNQMSERNIQSGAIPPSIVTMIYKKVADLNGFKDLSQVAERWTKQIQSQEVQQYIQQEAMKMVEQILAQQKAKESAGAII